MSRASKLRRWKKRETERQRAAALYRSMEGVGKDAKLPWSKTKEITSYLPGHGNIQMRMVPRSAIEVPASRPGKEKWGRLKSLWSRITGRGRGK